MTNDEVIFIHKDCGGLMDLVSVHSYEYYDGDVRDSELEFICQKCKKDVTWEDNQSYGM